LNPPLAIFITRASGSVVLTRGSFSAICWPRLPLTPARLAASACFRFSSGICATACFSRSTRSFAARLAAAALRDPTAAANSGSATWRPRSSTCFSASASSWSSVAPRRKLLAPAPARMRTPSWLIRLTLTRPLLTSDAMVAVNSPSSAPAWSTRKSDKR